MTNIARWLLVSCVGCSSVGRSGAPDATSVDTGSSTPDAASEVAPGVYATITGSELAGTYALTQTVECNIDIETGAYRIFGGGADYNLDLFSQSEPEAGTTDSSPDFWVIVTDDAFEHSTYYPQDTGGSCAVMIEQSWPLARARIACTGGPFAISDGVAICPAM